MCAKEMRPARSMSRRQFLLGASLGTAVIASAGSGGQAFSEAAGGTSPKPGAVLAASTPANVTIKRGGILRAAQIYDIQPNAPHTTTENSQMLYAQLMDPLLRFDHEMKPKPVLAESWEFSKDYKTLTLRLRPNVKFHNGRAFEANDVVRNIQNVLDPKTGSQMLAPAQIISEMRTPDKRTVVLSLKRPSPSFLDLFETLFFVDMDGIADVRAGKRIVGTGPFEWVEWRPGEVFKAKRFDGYWNGPVALDGFEVRVSGDMESMLVSLEAGAIDMAVNPTQKDIPRLRSNKNISVLVSETGFLVYYIGANVATKPLDN